MQPLKIKEYLVYYPEQRVIVFPMHEYQETIVSNIVKQYLDWDLLNFKMITCKEKYFQYFLEKEVDSVLDTFRIMFSDLNVKIITVYSNRELSDNTKQFFEEPARFNKKLLTFLKEKTKYFKPLRKNNLLFINTEGTFKDLKIGKPSGEEIEFLQSALDK